MKDINTCATKKNSLSRPESIIKGIDPVSLDLLKQMYSTLKDREERLVLYEKIWVSEIERIYTDKNIYNEYFLAGLEHVLNQAYALLKNDAKSWDIKKGELLTLIEKIVFIKNRDHVYKDFYGELETAVFSAIQLDFSKRISLTKIGASKENIFSYKAVILNTLIEAMETSVISKSSVSEVLQNIPGTMVIITDDKGNIKYSNKLAEELLGNEVMIKESISKILPDIPRVEKAFLKNEALQNQPFTFLAKGNKKISAKLNVALLQTSPIAEEFIYVIKIRQEHEAESVSVPQQTILDGLAVLANKLTDKDSKKLLEEMQKAAREL